MNWIFWFAIGALSGWLTGKLLGEKGYGKVVSTSCARGLDIFFGVVGISIGQYLPVWTVPGSGTLFGYAVTAVLGAAGCVGICRLVSERYFRSPSYRGMSRATFIEWHDELTVKELASWKKRRAEQTRSKSSTA